MKHIIHTISSMKTRTTAATALMAIALMTIVLAFQSSTCRAQGIPFIRNYSADEYGAHNRNFDILADENGNVYVANFEGLLYYDQAEWRIIHTPGITRVTEIYRDSEGAIWTGGYNFIGKLESNEKGCLQLTRKGEAGSFSGEVSLIWEENGHLFFLVGDGSIYSLNGNDVVKKDNHQLPSELQKADNNPDNVIQKEELEEGLYANATNGNGIIITDKQGHQLYAITETNGLCSNNVNHIFYNKRGLLWGATDNGIFTIAIPSVYSHFTPSEGLRGEVLDICKTGGQIFVGTLNGVFRRNGMTFVPVPGINHACWQLAPIGSELLAATSNGTYLLNTNGSCRQLTSASTTAVFVVGDAFYSGELDGVYLNDRQGNRKKVSNLEKVTRIYTDANNNMWLQNLYGQVWKKENDTFTQQTIGESKDNAATLIKMQDKVIAVSATDTKPFPYPLFSYTDINGTTWLTNNEGKQLYAWKDNKRQTTVDATLFPLKDAATRAMLVDNGTLWQGGDFGITLIDMSRKDLTLSNDPVLHIRSVSLGRDSILWGGFGDMPSSLPTLRSQDRNLRFTFSLEQTPVLGQALYRHRLNGGIWSAWSPNNHAEYFSISPGNYRFEVQAIDPMGRETNISSVNFNIQHPFYMRWYMLVLYLLLLALAVYAIIQLRLRRLEKEKIRLETIVQERTAEVVRQKDEIEEKSNSLEKALTELNEAQHELIRQEKMATVGKLTQGLIDRILNPLNYINNFSKLSEGLVKDIEANIEDEKENMDADNYEDTCDVLNMLRGNLQKVGEHGANTTRTLKAMEEMLKDRSGGIVSMDLVSVLRQDKDMLDNYFAEDIAKYGIKTTLDCNQEEILINGNAELLSKTMMSLLGNAIYAVGKKAQREKFIPEVVLKAESDGAKVTVTIRDNGIGIEETIINKIFDPFFTTKTTGEAAGVGLYLSREIIQNHGGDISVKSEKNNYSEFTIVLPALTA